MTCSGERRGTLDEIGYVLVELFVSDFGVRLEIDHAMREMWRRFSPLASPDESLCWPRAHG
jgi:hypothetical protein